MSLHDAFGPARRARCVNEKGGVVGTSVDPGALGGTFCERRIDIDHAEARTGDLLCLCEASIDRQEDGGFGVIEKLRDTCGRILPIEDDHNAPRLQRGEHSDKDPAILRHQDRHPVAYPPARTRRCDGQVGRPLRSDPHKLISPSRQCTAIRFG